MSFKNFSKFRKPYAKVSFNSFEEALKSAVMYDELKKLAWREEGVYFWVVNGLANESYIESLYTNKHRWNKFEPSDIGDQIGYERVGESIYDFRVDQSDRSFITDIGINPESRHNKHLVFTNKALAEAYLKYQKNNATERAEREAFLDRWEYTMDSYVDDRWDEEYEEQDYHYAMY